MTASSAVRHSGAAWISQAPGMPVWDRTVAHVKANSERRAACILVIVVAFWMSGHVHMLGECGHLQTPGITGSRHPLQPESVVGFPRASQISSVYKLEPSKMFETTRQPGCPRNIDMSGCRGACLSSGRWATHVRFLGVPLTNTAKRCGRAGAGVRAWSKRVRDLGLASGWQRRFQDHLGHLHCVAKAPRRPVCGSSAAGMWGQGVPRRRLCPRLTIAG